MAYIRANEWSNKEWQDLGRSLKATLLLMDWRDEGKRDRKNDVQSEA